MKLLIDQWNATPEELAGWIWQGPEEGSLSAYLNVTKLKNPPKFHYDSYMGEDYLSPLMSCWFLKDDIVNFNPVDRYITGESLIKRWSQKPGIKAKAFILAKIAESRLTDYHPTLGGTRGSNSEDMSFPPLESGLFVVSDIEEIEREDFEVESDNITENINNQMKGPEKGTPEWFSQNAKKAINARHDKPGGSRDKQKQIKDVWASGKYTSRDICAEEECAALNMSFSTARKALRNTPNPKKT